MNSTRNTDVVCLRYNGDPATTLPCGYGPNNTNASNVQLYSLTDTALLGATQLQARSFRCDSSNLLNELARYVNGLPSPSGLLERIRARPATRSMPRLPAQAAPHHLDSSVRNVVAVRDHAAGSGSRAVLQRLANDAVQRAAGDRHDPLER